MSALKDAASLNAQVDLRFLGPFFWRWYHAHSHNRVLTIRKLLGVVSITVLVKDARPLFVMLFGDEPASLELPGLLQ